MNTSHSTTTTAPERRIQYDPVTRDFAGYVDGILIGYYTSYHHAEVAIDRLIFERLRRQPAAVAA